MFIAIGGELRHEFAGTRRAIQSGVVGGKYRHGDAAKSYVRATGHVRSSAVARARLGALGKLVEGSCRNLQLQLWSGRSEMPCECASHTLFTRAYVPGTQSCRWRCAPCAVDGRGGCMLPSALPSCDPSSASTLRASLVRWRAAEVAVERNGSTPTVCLLFCAPRIGFHRRC